jgi:hypothetical protein
VTTLATCAGDQLEAPTAAPATPRQLAQGQRTINNYENQPLGQLKCAGGYFEGQSTAGVPVRLTR